MNHILSEHIKQELSKELSVLLRDLLKTIKALSIYPEDNALPAKMRSSISTRFVELVENYEGLRFEFRANEVNFMNEVVFTDSGREEVLAGLFYHAGIIQLEFRFGLTIDDFIRFLDIIKNYVNDRSPDRDLVTLLWQENFDTIRFLSLEDLALDQISSEDSIRELYPSIDETDKGLDFAAIFMAEKDEEESDGLEDSGQVHIRELSDEGEEDLNKMGLEKTEKLKDKPDPINDLINHAALTTKDSLEVQLLVEKNRGFDPYRTSTRILQEILAWCDNYELFSETVDICEHLLGQLLASGGFAAAADFVDSLRKLQMGMGDAKPNRAKRLAEFFRQAGDAEHIKALTDIINRQEKIDIVAIETYLEALGWESLFYITEMLGHLVARESRMLVCDYLAKHGRKNLNIIGKGVNDRQWYVVRNTVFILGRIGCNEVVKFLRTAAKHEDIRVREETIRSLLMVGTEDAANALTPFLEDTEQNLRRLALDHLGRIGTRASFEYIEDIITNASFRNLSMKEQGQFLIVYSRLGGADAVQILDRLIARTQFFLPLRKTPLRLAAMKAMAHNPSREAEEKIVEYTNSWQKWLRVEAAETIDYRNRLMARETEKKLEDEND